MTDHPNWVALATTSFPRKIFVRASELAESEVKRKKAKLEGERNLKGSEVKDFYDEIMSTETTCPSDKFADESEQRKRKLLEELESDDKIKTTEKIVRTKADLIRAAQSNNVEVLEECLDHGMKVDERDEYGWTPLMTAACSGSIDAAEYLLARGADPNVRDKAKNSCRTLARKKGHHNVLEMISAYNQTQRRQLEVSESEVQDESDPFFCAECKVTFKESTREQHQSSTLHQVSLGTKTEHSTVYGIDQTNRGFQMMLNSGWNKDKGLGADGKEGKKYPVKTMLKRDRAGLGSAKDSVMRVTHFKARDAAAVSNAFRERKERQATMDKFARDKKLRKDQAKSKLLRQELQGI